VAARKSKPQLEEFIMTRPHLFFWRLRRFCFFIPLITLIWLMPAPAVAADVDLAWDANQESDLAGYKLHYGTKSGTYSNIIDVGKRTSYAVTGLAAGTTYYFAATAYNTKGLESGYSNQVTGTTPAANPSLGISNLTPGDYQIAALRTGDFYYTDRNFRIMTMPATLEGMTAIKTANNDKFNKQAAFLSFTINQDMDLYVAYDARSIRLPSWLTAGFTDTGHIIDTTDVTFTLWRKTVVAGAVTLPGNYYGDPAGGESNYFALLAPATGDSLPGATPSVTVDSLQPGDYRVSPLRKGDLYYTDRNFTITSMPADFEGMTTIRTANNDKYNSQAQLLSFTIKESAKVYVAYDARATRMPTWLTGFTDTGLTIQTTDVGMKLWQKTFSAGTVILPGNYYGSPEGPDSNYFVMLAPVTDSVTPAIIQPNAYQVASLNVGDTQFIDRDFKVTAVPVGFAGMKAIKTANNDKWNNQAEFLSFTVNRNATVYVAYDTRATKMPSWLTANFTKTGHTIQTTDVAMTLWQRAVSAGTVVLPGNYYGNPLGVDSNYFVLVD
jgi:hypothetical protein